MKQDSLISVIREYNKYTDKKVSIPARLTTYFLWFALLYCFMCILIYEQSEKFAFSLIMSAVLCVALSVWLIGKLKLRYIVLIEANREKYVLARRVRHLKLLSSQELEGFVRLFLQRRLCAKDIKRADVFLLCDGVPVIIITGDAGVECSKIKMVENFGYKHIIVICDTAGQKHINADYMGNIDKLFSLEDVVSEFDELDFEDTCVNRLNLSSMLNEKTAKLFLKLSFGAIVLAITFGGWKYFGGISVVFGLIGVAMQVLIKTKK